jgi:hypothetical protein
MFTNPLSRGATPHWNLRYRRDPASLLERHCCEKPPRSNGRMLRGVGANVNTLQLAQSGVHGFQRVARLLV